VTDVPYFKHINSTNIDKKSVVRRVMAQEINSANYQMKQQINFFDLIIIR